MKISKQVHQIKIYFHVTEAIERFVNVYLIEGTRGCYLIDTGVAGAEKLIKKAMLRHGRQPSELKAIFLTHSHPDHMGAASRIKKRTGAKIYASESEKPWIEDIRRQFAARPIPNFYKLLEDSVTVDESLTGEEIICLEPGITIRVLATPGHSAGSISYFYEEEGILFTGDAIPVADEAPIYVNYGQSLESLEQIGRLEPVQLYCPAWADAWQAVEGRKRIKEAKSLLAGINHEVRRILEENEKQENTVLFKRVCEGMGIDPIKANPLFRTSIYANIEALRNGSLEACSRRDKESEENGDDERSGKNDR